MTRPPAVLVLGATGHLGQAVLRALHAEGCRLTAASRRARPGVFAGLGARVLAGDADDPGRLSTWIEGHDVVIDAAAPAPLGLAAPGSHARQALLAHAARRTERLLSAVSERGARLGFISSFTTLPRPEHGLAAAEAAWRRAVYPYFEVKRQMEERVLDAAASGLPAVVVNPTACLGPWDDKPAGSSLVAQIVEQRLSGVVSQVINVIDVRDAAAGLLAALRAERYGVPIPLSGHDVSVDALVRRIAHLAGVAPPALLAPPALGALAAVWMESLHAWTGVPTPGAWLAAPLVCDGHAMPPGALQRALGVRIRPLEETLRDAVAWRLAFDARRGPG